MKMDSEQTKREIAKEVCFRFVNHQLPSERRPLILRYKKPLLLDEMENSLLLASRDNRQAYLPTLDSFGLLDETNPDLDCARISTVSILRLLKHLYELEDRKTPYSFGDLLMHADR
jgi:hypothetical protein